MSSSKLNKNRHLVIASAGCGGGGSVASVALHQSRELAHYMRVTMVSDSFPPQTIEGVSYEKVSSFKFNFLRRFAHVPNQYAFVCSSRNYLEALHKRNPIDMIMCHSHALAALSAKPLKDRYGIPFAIVTHGDIFDRPKGTYDGRLTAFYEAVTPPAYRNADLIIALSPYMASRAIKGGANPALVYVIPNGIDPEDIGLDISAVSSQQCPYDGTLQLLYVGGLTVLKGVDVLIQACGMLKQRGVIFSLKLIGEGILEKTLRNMVKEMDLSDAVSFLGKIPRSQLGAYYRAADLVCVPSLSDSLPTVVLEALISGTPVIGSDTGGIPFMVSNGRTGWIVPHGAPHALADMVEDVSKNPAILPLLGNAAFREASERFNWGNIGRQLSEIIAGAITEGVNPRP